MPRKSASAVTNKKILKTIFSRGFNKDSSFLAALDR
jgi:hypothetical protein